MALWSIVDVKRGRERFVPISEPQMQRVRQGTFSDTVIDSSRDRTISVFAMLDKLAACRTTSQQKKRAGHLFRRPALAIIQSNAATSRQPS